MYNSEGGGAPLDPSLFITLRAEPSFVFLRKRERLAPFIKVYKFTNYRNFVISVKCLVFPLWKRRRKESRQDFEVAAAQTSGLVNLFKFLLYCRLIYMLSMLYVRLTIKVKVGIPESFKRRVVPPQNNWVESP